MRRKDREDREKCEECHSYFFFFFFFFFRESYLIREFVRLSKVSR